MYRARGRQLEDHFQENPCPFLKTMIMHHNVKRTQNTA